MLGDVKRIIRESDIVIEVVDARIPFDTRSREIEKFCKKNGKKMIIVINKSDLVPEGFLREVREEIEEEGIPCVYISSRSRKGLRKLREKIKEVARGFGKKDKIKICVVGYANTGKSSLINALRGRHVCETAPIPGWTKKPKLVRISRKIYLFDTPGVIPAEKAKAEVLGLIRAEKIEDPVETAKKLLEKISNCFPDEIRRVYKVEKIPDDPEELLKEIAKRLGRLKKGGEPDVEVVSRMIIKDWYEGKIRVYFKKWFE